MFFAYILKSVGSGKYFTGVTDNLEEIVTKHNEGYIEHTKNKGPFILIYKEEFQTRSEAQERENYLKSLRTKEDVEKLIRAAFV